MDKMEKKKFALPKRNYYFLLLGLLVMVIGYALMYGGGTKDPAVFLEKELFSFRRITLAPILILIGVAIEVWAIMYRPKNLKE